MMESRKAVWTNKMLAVAGAAAVVAACSPPQPVWGNRSIRRTMLFIRIVQVWVRSNPAIAWSIRAASWARIRLLQALPAYGCKMAARL